MSHFIHIRQFAGMYPLCAIIFYQRFMQQKSNIKLLPGRKNQQPDMAFRLPVKTLEQAESAGLQHQQHV